MTAIAIVKIQVDDTDFKKFIASTKGLKIGVSPAHSKEEEKHFKQQKKRWLEEDRHYRNFTKNILDATKSLAKWTAITGGLGVAGAYGSGKLGNSVEQQRFTSRGLGISSAEQEAFKINYRTLVNTEDLLQKVSESLSDYSKRAGFYAAGLSESDITGKDAAEVAAALIPKLKEAFEKGGQSVQGAEAFKLTQFVDLATLKRLADLQSGELETADKQFALDVSNLKLTTDQQKSWIELSQQATRAGQQIEVEFVKALQMVAPELKELSSALVVDIKHLSGTNGLKDGVIELSKGVHSLAEYLGSSSFKADITAFMEGVHKVANFFGLGDQSNIELQEFDKAIANGEVDYSFKTPPTDEEKKQLAHDWYSTRKKSSWFEPQDNFKKFEEEGRKSEIYKFLDKTFKPSAQPSTSITINNNSSADVMYNMNRLGTIK